MKSDDGNDETSPVCAEMFGRIGTDPTNMDADVTAHVGSCVTCFRVFSELRDAPRLASILRADPPALPAPEDRFWDDLAARTTEAIVVSGTLGGFPNAPAKAFGEQSSPPPTRSRSWRRRGPIAAVAFAAAAAAALLLVIGRGPNPPSVPSGAQGAAVAEMARAVSEDEAADETDAVAELDGSALRRLLEHLRAGAPGELTALVGGDPEALFDDEIGLDDEIVGLDGAALLRLERSLEGAL
jgi:hypothetical protein